MENGFDKVRCEEGNLAHDLRGHELEQLWEKYRVLFTILAACFVSEMLKIVEKFESSQR